jgi:hypothetical protein
MSLLNIHDTEKVDEVLGNKSPSYCTLAGSSTPRLNVIMSGSHATHMKLSAGRAEEL